MSFYIQFLCDNFAQKYSQNAGFGIFILKIIWGVSPMIPTPQHKKRGKTPTPSHRFKTLLEPLAVGQQICQQG
jgi:hypothetical protein